jgi:hypothetical protein
MKGVRYVDQVTGDKIATVQSRDPDPDPYCFIYQKFKINVMVTYRYLFYKNIFSRKCLGRIRIQPDP